MTFQIAMLMHVWTAEEPAIGLQRDDLSDDESDNPDLEEARVELREAGIGTVSVE